MRELNYECDLNVLAEFKKYDVHKVHRGVITRDCVANALKSEDIEPKLIEEIANSFMKHDLDHDGRVLVYIDHI